VSAAQERLAQFLLQHTSALAGLQRLPILGACISWAGEKLVPRDTLAWVQVRKGPAQGLWLQLNPRTGGIYFEGGGEIAVQEALQQYVKRDMTFYDIGANIGFFSLLAAKLVRSEGRVTAFEADPEIAARLRENVARNQFLNIGVEERAVWSEPRAVFFARTDPATSPDRGLGRVVDSRAMDTIEVEAITLDEYARIHPPPDFLKCDVEGAEVEVFRGAQRLLQERRPGIICEMHSKENRDFLLEMFSQFGYDCQSRGENHVVALPR
jgi:FkbM family methyltransferase